MLPVIASTTNTSEGGVTSAIELAKKTGLIKVENKPNLVEFTKDAKVMI